MCVRTILRLFQELASLQGLLIQHLSDPPPLQELGPKTLILAGFLGQRPSKSPEQETDSHVYAVHV